MIMSISYSFDKGPNNQDIFLKYIWCTTPADNKEIQQNLSFEKLQQLNFKEQLQEKNVVS